MNPDLMLDTHTAIWFVFDTPSLNPRNREHIARSRPFVSSMSIYEAGFKILRGRWQGIAPSLWPEILAALPVSGIAEVAPDAEVLRLSAALDWEHGDPGDRILVAEARRRNVPIMTKDQAIREFEGVRTIWL